MAIGYAFFVYIIMEKEIKYYLTGGYENEKKK